MWRCWLVAPCRAGSSSQDCHGTSLLLLAFSRGPQQPLPDITSSQAHLLTTSLSSCNGHQPRLLCTWSDFWVTCGFSRDLLISSLKNPSSFFLNYYGQNIQKKYPRHPCYMISKSEKLYCRCEWGFLFASDAMEKVISLGTETVTQHWTRWKVVWIKFSYMQGCKLTFCFWKDVCLAKSFGLTKETELKEKKPSWILFSLKFLWINTFFVVMRNNKPKPSCVLQEWITI